MGVFDSRSLDNEKKKRRYLIICGVIMALMIGLRYKGVGSGDTGFYYRNWEMMAGLPLPALPKQLGRVALGKPQLCCRFGIRISDMCFYAVAYIALGAMGTDIIGSFLFRIHLLFHLSQLQKSCSCIYGIQLSGLVQFHGTRIAASRCDVYLPLGHRAV